MRTFKLWIGLIFTLGLAACGGGGGGGSTSSTPASNSTPTATTTTAAAFFGPIAGLGSIVVNGVRFETVGVNVQDSDDIYGSAKFNSALALGMTVSLGGNVDETALTGTPAQIRVIGGVRGVLNATPSAGATSIATTNGQTVSVDTNTVYSGKRIGGISVTSLTSLLSGDAVEIYGIPQANGNFLATRVNGVETVITTNKLAIRGTIDSIPSANNYIVKTSSTDTVTVACSGSCVISPLGATLAINTPVRILASDTTSLSGGVLTANKIQSLSSKLVTEFTGVATNYAKIKGYTQQIGSDWYVAGIKVTGATFTTVGQFVEVTGTWSGSELQATKVESESSRNVSGTAYKNEFYGAVESKSGNTFTVQGISVDASNATFEGRTLASLANGNYVEVKGTLSNGVLNAIKVGVKTASGSPSNDGFQGSKFEVYGTVTGWRGIAYTFTLSSNRGVFTALASSAVILNTLPTENSNIEVKGYLDSNQQLIITRLEVKANGFDNN